MFAIEPATATGPRGGKRRGYTVAWRGAGHPPMGLGQRSGWYLRRNDALERAAVYNRAKAELDARPSHEPDLSGGGYFVALIGPNGERHFICHGPHSPDGREALRFASAAIATAAASVSINGNPEAYWNSERESARRTAERMKGWRFEILTGEG